MFKKRASSLHLLEIHLNPIYAGLNSGLRVLQKANPLVIRCLIYIILKRKLSMALL